MIFLNRQKLSTRKQASLSNFVVETFWVFVATIISPWVRVLLPGKNNKTQLISSVSALLIPIIVAIALRAFMPTLPE